MRNRVSGRSVTRMVEQDPSKSGPMEAVRPLDTFDEHGQPTLTGFRPDERWMMVRAYGE